MDTLAYAVMGFTLSFIFAVQLFRLAVEDDTWLVRLSYTIISLSLLAFWAVVIMSYVINPILG